MRFTRRWGWLEVNVGQSPAQEAAERRQAAAAEAEAQAWAPETILPTGRHHYPDELAITMG